MSGSELTEHCEAGYVYFTSGGVLSAVTKGTEPQQVWDYLPAWDEPFYEAGYQFQTPLTQLEIICFDGYAWGIVCPPELSVLIKKNLPQACPADEFFKS